MKLSTLFLITHFAAAAASAALLAVAMLSGLAPAFAAAAVLGLLAPLVAGIYAARRIQTGLRMLEAVVADHEYARLLKIGLQEFDQSTQRIAASAARWETVSANTRQQAKELQAMIGLLDRRESADEPSTTQLRNLLAGLGNTLRTQLAQIQRGSDEIEQYARSITDGAETQARAVIKTTTTVEQLSMTIDTVSGSAKAAQVSIAHACQSAASALTLVNELIEGMKRVRSESRTCEKKLRGLCDPSQQISAIVGTISDIAARTDLLALNASIESIRAGEHGRGFAIVADEVRKLAEQAADATREISSLIDSMQIVTQESIRGMVREREQVESEFDRALAAQQVLQQICDANPNDSGHLRRISEASTQQLQLAQDVVLAVEQVSEIAKTARGGAERVAWTVKSLAEFPTQFLGTVERLQNCGKPAGRPAESHDHAAPIAPVALPVSTHDLISAG
jgi:methyl-accepting chemotaxis protein